MRRLQFYDRVHAGQMLAVELMEYAQRPDVLILGLPRGGIPVAFEVARKLQVPLDVLIVRKLGVPGEEELALGAVASDGVCVLNNNVIRDHMLSRRSIEQVIERERRELERRELLYRGKRPFPDMKQRTIVLIDDGIATGATMRAAVAAIHQRKPAEIIVAVPVAASSTCEALERQGERVICLIRAEQFMAVCFWYQCFDQTSDEEVRHLLDQAAHGWMVNP